MTELLAGPFRNGPLADVLAERRPLDEVGGLLLETLVLVPVTVDDDGTRRLITERNDTGAVAIPVFASTESVAEWNAETGVAVVEGAAVLDMAHEVGAVAVLIDVAGPAPAAIPIANLTDVAARRGRRLAEGRQLAVGAPADPPPAEVVDAVRRTVRASKGVARAYLFQMAGHGTTPSLVAGVELDEDADEAAVMPAFVERLSAALPTGRTVDALPVAGPLADAVREAVPAIS